MKGASGRARQCLRNPRAFTSIDTLPALASQCCLRAKNTMIARHCPHGLPGAGCASRSIMKPIAVRHGIVELDWLTVQQPRLVPLLRTANPEIPSTMRRVSLRVGNSPPMCGRTAKSPGLSSPANVFRFFVRGADEDGRFLLLPRLPTSSNRVSVAFPIAWSLSVGLPRSSFALSHLEPYLADPLTCPQ